jgi:predicted metal-dependent phosphoesterase TrpH
VGSFFDCHIHTREGSNDSALSPEELVSEMRRKGLTGALVTEHQGWPKHEFERFAQDQDVVLIRAHEIGTEWGHIIAIGLEGYSARFNKAIEVLQALNDVNGFMIIAHPFRFLFEPARIESRNILFPNISDMPSSAEEASKHPIFEVVNTLEVVNGANSMEENRFAEQVASILGRSGTGGSDAHSIQGIGKGSTFFHGDIRGQKDLLEALRAGAFTPAEGFNAGRTSFYGIVPDNVALPDL